MYSKRRYPRCGGSWLFRKKQREGDDLSDNLADAVREAVARHHAAAIALSEDMGDHPELSAEEFESSRKIVELLKNGGYEVEYPYLNYETAFDAVLRNGDGPKAAIMVEYDALPEIGHACGHNLHGALSVLAGLALADLRDHFRGTVRVIGTPAEEADGAKVGMADKGIFDDLSVAMMMHSMGGGISQPDMDALSLRCSTVTYKGRTAHAAAAPWEGRSALAAARKFLDLADARRECFTPDMRVSGIITDGGRATNIIPDRAEVKIEFRTDSMARLNDANEMILKCAKGAAMAMDCEVSWKPALSDFADMVRVKALEDEAERLFKEKGMPVEPVSPPIGSTDVGNVSYRCPAIQPLIAITGKPYALHTVEFARATREAEAHRAMATGAEILARLALKVLCDDGFRKEVHDDFVRCRDRKIGHLCGK
jgi:amidohydrolase